MRYATLCLVFTLALTVLIRAQAPAPGQIAPAPPAGPQTPARDRQATTKGTAVVKGLVLDFTTGRPIRGARVTAMSGPEPPSADTDAEGRFELRDLRPGRHQLNVIKPGYLTLLQTNNNKPLPPFEVKEGETIEKVVVRVARGGVIAGNVFDEFGDPYLGAEVRAMRYRYVNGRRELVQVSSFGPMQPFSDDLGGFRIFGLEPGEYYVQVRARRDFGPPSRALAEGAAPTYFPGTPNVAEARRVTVRSGAETQGIVIQMAVAKLSRISGRVISASSNVSRVSVQAMAREGNGFSSNFGSSVKPDGSYEVRNLPPGSYMLVARPMPEGPAGTRNETESGRVMITVNGEEINDLTIVMSPGGTIRGRFVTDEGIAPPFSRTGMSVFPQALEPTSLMFMRTQTSINDDWTFEIPGIFDRVRLQPGFGGPPDASMGTWRFKAMMLNGQDVTDSGVEVRSGGVLEGVELVYTRKVTRLSGKLLDDREQQAQGWVILFAADESKWTPQSRFIRPSRPGPDGTFQMTPIPYDDYLIAGVADIEDGQWQDPDFLHALKNVATRITIGEGETKVQDVKLVEWRR